MRMLALESTWMKDTMYESEFKQIAPFWERFFSSIYYKKKLRRWRVSKLSKMVSNNPVLGIDVYIL